MGSLVDFGLAIESKTASRRVGDRVPKTQAIKRGKWARKGLGMP